MATFTDLPSKDATRETAPRVREAGFGDGYQQRVGDGIHGSAAVWRLSFANRTDAAADAIDGARWVEWAAIAKSYSGDTYTEATRIAVQCFGGVGFTWEYDIHFYMKRARLSQQLFGSPTYHRQLLTRELRSRTAD